MKNNRLRIVLSYLLLCNEIDCIDFLSLYDKSVILTPTVLL